MHVAKGALAGLISGLIASWVMELFQAEYVKRRPLPPSDSLPATEKAADRLAGAAIGRPLSGAERKAAGPAVHYAMGGMTGALYGTLAELLPVVRSAGGLPFGALVWLLADEIALPTAGLSGSPLETPAEVNRYAFASHLVYGSVTELLRGIVRALI